MKSTRPFLSLVLSGSLILSACGPSGSGGGSSSGGSSGGSGGSGGGSSTPSSVYAAPGAEALTVADVQKIISHAVAEAQARTRPAVIAVTDRVGNVLAAYSMTGAPATTRLRAGTSGNLDAQNVVAPAAAGAIAKALTGAYLSSAGNAFSSRTASMIVQQHFPPSPATTGLESGPLFGVQFSQLPCSDLAQRYVVGGGATAFIGPKRSPLGLAADAGGFPLYKNGAVVGGVGVMADGDYGFDTNVLDIDADIDEAIALAATTDFAAPTTITADRVSLDGTTLRYSDATSSSLAVNPASAPAFSLLGAGVGGLTVVTGYFDGAAILAGQVYGNEASGVRKASTAEFDNPDAYILTNGSGAPRYPAISGTDGGLTSVEVRALLEEAFKVMSHARAQIRQPLNSRAQVTISVVDSRGTILGIVRSPDAPIFGIDVSLQKARTAAFFSGAAAAADLGGDPSADVRGFVPATRTFLGNSTALTGATAFGARSIGNIARPYFPDGQVGTANGPLSRPIAQWSPFSTGLQSALVLTNIAQHLTYVSTGGADTRARCSFIPDVTAGQNRLQNGIQIFPGAVPVYKGGVMVGAVGVSGDGIDQDDMISFLGVYNAGTRTATLGEAASSIRADQIVISVSGSPVRLRYVNCPFSPFIDTSDTNVCSGK